MFNLKINKKQRYEFNAGTGLEIITINHMEKPEKCTEASRHIANFWPKVLGVAEKQKDESGIVTTFVKVVLFFKTAARVQSSLSR